MSKRELAKIAREIAQIKKALSTGGLESSHFKSAGYQKLRESASYDEMERWVENAIKLYHQDEIELGDVLFPLTSWYQDVHSAIEHIAGGKRSGGVGMSARKLLKWYDEN